LQLQQQATLQLTRQHSAVLPFCGFMATLHTKGPACRRQTHDISMTPSNLTACTQNTKALAAAVAQHAGQQPLCRTATVSTYNAFPIAAVLLLQQPIGAA
jgi:hypothetical protein